MRRAAATLACIVGLVACSADARPSREPAAAAGDTTGARPLRLGTIGRAATSAEVQAWDIDVNPSGRGLPAGRGTSAAGARIFAAKCAACHGARGEGVVMYPRLIGREPHDGFPFGQDPKLVKTIGNYWPYSTTVFDYIRRAMPLNAPGSLSSGEVYDLVAFLLAENEIVSRDAVMDARTLPAVRMPAQGRFVRDNRTGGARFR